MLTFVYPWAAILLILPFFVSRWTSPFKTQRSAIRVPFLQSIATILGEQPKSGASVEQGNWIQKGLLWLCWVLVLISLARPQWVEPPLTRELPMRDLMLAVDLSGSMEATDFTNRKGENISRLDAVKQVLHPFLEQRKGDRVGMIFFGSAPFLQVPFTEDLKVCQQLLDEAQVRMAGPQTAFGDAIGLAIKHFEQSNMEKKLLIVLTDGNDTASQLPPRKAAQIAHQNGITIYTIGIGDPRSVGEEAFDEDELKEVARAAQGQYYLAQDRDQLEQIYKTIEELEPQQVQSQSYRPKTELYFYSLLTVLLLTMIYHGLKIKSSIKLRDPSYESI